MKIVYFGSVYSTDTDFPLIRELQIKGVDVVSYFTVMDCENRAGLIDIHEIKPVDDIINATEYEAFRRYSSYVNLDNMYVVNNYHCRRIRWEAWYIWLKLFKHIKKQEADVFHYIWPLKYQRSLLYRLHIPKVMTVHDPISHSSQESEQNEKFRKRAFKEADRIVILNSQQKDAFESRYNIPNQNIMVTRLGTFNWLDYVGKGAAIKGNYILFWGQLQSHKGVDVLLKAMMIVHKTIPDLKCIIAGRGRLDFDITKYEKLDYIEFRNYFISLEELSDLLHGCLFAVCPYKDATQSGVVQTAFSANVPLIVTNVGALPEVVSDNETGIVVPPNDENRLADAIIELATNKEKVSLFKENLLKWNEQMSWSSIADQYIELYKSLLDEKTRK